MKTGLLLVNLGTPKAPTTEAVRPYLREFLMDPRVINIPGPMRWLLVHGIIAPFRAPKSAHAYQSIWTDAGSPLLVASEALTAQVSARLDAIAQETGTPKVHTALAMRYGEPSIPAAIEKLKQAGVERLVVFPLYPQYSSATTGSSMERVMEVMKQQWAMPALSFVPPFYAHPAFLDAVIAAGDEALERFRPDHVLFSYHGVPEDHVTQCDPSGEHCLQQGGCCDAIGDENAFCYRAQCVATTKGLTRRLGLDESRTSLSFQSRLGKQEWVKPYTDVVVKELADKGVKRLAVFCPAFVADCLETLEEIGIRAKEDFVAAGGEDLALIPCLNAHPSWADAVVKLAQEASGWLPAKERPRIQSNPLPVLVTTS